MDARSEAPEILRSKRASCHYLGEHSIFDLFNGRNMINWSLADARPAIQHFGGPTSRASNRCAIAPFSTESVRSYLTGQYEFRHR